MKLIVAGHGRHGKDTVCEILRDEYGMTFRSSSQTAADHFIFDNLKNLLGYKTPEECYEDRSNHRALWFELIKAINYKDLSTLGRKIFEDNDIYCGIRNDREFFSMKEDGLFDHSIWVDASKRHPPESDKSCTVTPKDMDIILDNNGTLEELRDNLKKVMQSFGVESTHGTGRAAVPNPRK